MYKKVGNLTLKSIIASILVLATVFVYVIGDNFSFMAYFKDDKTVENTFFDTGYDGLRSVSDLTLAETGTEMGNIGEDLNSGFEKLVSDCSNKKTFSNGKSEFIELVSDLKNRSLSELDSTNNGTEEYENYRNLVVSGFDEIEDYANQLNEDNTEEILGKIEDTVSFEEPYVGLADDLPFSNVAVDEVKEEKFVPERSASSYAPENTEYSPADLEFTNDAVINDEIRTEFADYATTLEVYQYIKNNYMPEFYYGSRKGSVGAFEERAGNDYDLSSLLIAVLRDRNIPARYVRGNIEITAEQAIQWTGAEDIYSAARIIAALGIPVTTLTSENGIVAVRLEHVWVEAYVPYTDYRGAGNNAGDSLWIPLDVSFKCLVNNEGVDLSTLDDYINDESNYISSDTVINDIEVGDFANYFEGGESALAKYILENNYGGGTREEVFGGREIKSEDLGYLPLTLPYSVSEIIASFDDIPTELTDTLSFSLAGNTVSDFDYFGSTSINKTFYTPDIYGKRIILAYAPATADDGELLAKYNGLFNTPAYLLKLKPQLIIDGEVVAEGFTCNAGYSQKYSITTHNSSSYTQDGNVENSVTVGGIYCIALDYGNISAASLQNSADNMEALKTTATEANIYTDEVMGEMLNSVAKAYFTQLDQLNSVAAGQYNVVAARDLSVGIVGFNVNVVYTFNRPTELNEGGIFLDIGRDVHSVISVENNLDNEKKYMLLTGMYASAMEHGVIEQITGVEAVSTIKAFEYAGKNNIPLHSVTKDNLTDKLNVLNVSEKVKQDIRTAVNAGKLVIIPEETLNINQWSGVGYMVLDTDTFACAYMISGGLAGGSMTWDQALSEYLLYVGIGLLVGLLFELASCILTGWLGAAFMAVKIVMLGIWIYQLYQLYQQWKATKEPVFLQEILVQLLAGITVAGIFGACGSKLKGEIAEIAAKLKASPFWGKPIGGGGGTCFIAGTPISTPEGLVSIENIRADDIVYSFDEETQVVSEQVVEQTFVHENKNLVHINIGYETITTTPEHPFYIPKKGFVKAVDLRAGDILWTVNGEYVIIEKVQHEILENPIKVYNFRVANNHTYFVGNNAVGVHNSCGSNSLLNLKVLKMTADLSDKLERVRIRYNASSSDRNVAILEGEIDGDPHNLESISGKVKFNSDGSNNKGNFTPANKNYYEYIGDEHINTRYYDTEYKLIDYIRSLYDADHSVSGKITIITKQKACPSCRSVIEQFAADFPNIEIELVEP